MRISVVMATYNGEKYIEEQIKSILNQKRLPDEIIINDDGSKDKTLEILKKYVNEYSNIEWKVNKNVYNLGYIKNFLKAIYDSTGDIIILSDQDDIWSTEKTSIIQSYFETYPDMLSLHMDYSIIDEDGRIIKNNGIKYRKHIEKYTIQHFISRLNYCGMSSAFRGSIKKYLSLLNVDLLPTHDWTIHAISVLHDGMYVSDKVVSYRRAHGDNVALNLNPTIRKGIYQRIEVVNGYYTYYLLLKNINDLVCSPLYTDYIIRLINTQKIRLNYLNKRGLFAWLLESRHIKYFPTVSSYICDGLYLINLY